MEAILLGLVAFLAQSEYALGTSLLSRPIVTGMLTGLVIGDLKQGIIMGAYLELAFLGSFSIGGSIPPDVVTGAILAVAFAITSHSGVETVLILALPIATFTLILKNLYLGIFIPVLAHKADSYADQGNIKKVELMHILAGILLSGMLGLIVAIGYNFGSDNVTQILNAIPEFVKHGLEVTTGIMPALGFAMLARLLFTKHLLPLFFLGFFIVAYLDLSLTAIVIFGVIIAYYAGNLTQPTVVTQGGELEDEDF